MASFRPEPWERDGRCKHDPSGTLSFTFEYWALFGSEDPASLIWGACWHPIVSGTGDFEGAGGVLVMADTPTKEGVKTAYTGNVTCPAQRTTETAFRLLITRCDRRRAGCRSGLARR